MAVFITAFYAIRHYDSSFLGSNADWATLTDFEARDYWFKQIDQPYTPWEHILIKIITLQGRKTTLMADILVSWIGTKDIEGAALHNDDAV